MTPRRAVFAALPGGASHVASIAGAASALDLHADVLGWAGVSAGFLVAVMHAFGKAEKLPGLLTTMLAANRVLDVWPDGRLGLCEWKVIPTLVDEVLGRGVRLGDALTPLVGVVTSADTGQPVYLSKRDTPNVLVSEACRASSAIHPLAPFVPVPSLGTVMSPDVRLFIDGGFTDNLPDHVFDHQIERTVSVALNVDESSRVRPGDALAQCLAVMRAVTFSQSQRKSRRHTINVDIEAQGSGLDFDLTPTEVQARFARGAAAVTFAVNEGRFLPI